MRVIVPTCQKYYWSLRPFAHQFNIYWSEMQPVLVGGFEGLGFNLPGNFEFKSIDGQSYPAERWSDGLIRLLNSIDDYCFILMLEDYWLTRGVNHLAISSLDEYMRMYPEVLRIDLTADRLHSGHAKDVGTWGHLDIIETDQNTPYQWSTQACVVNRKNFRECLQPGIAPWDWELRGNELIPEGMRVLGTRQRPVRYINAIGMGLDEDLLYRTQHVMEGLGGKTIERLTAPHITYMRDHGILPRAA